MAALFLPDKNLKDFLQFLHESYRVYVPVKKNEKLFYTLYDPKQSESYAGNMVIGEVRAFDPLKAFFFRPRETVARDFSPEIPGAEKKPLCIVGVKACDLTGLQVLDLFYTKEEYQDPFYNRYRQNALIIASDCTSTLDTCFCSAFGHKPFPEKEYDINLSWVEGGFVVQAATAKGQKMTTARGTLFREANELQIRERDKTRQTVAQAVDENLRTYDIPVQDALDGVVEKNYLSNLWREEAESCVECGGCNMICPTCHCFLLYDQKVEETMARLRIWDSCMLKDFARVAGGANPRPRLWMRLRNRFEMKFDFFPKRNNFYACTGCGRCISACPAKIDIRTVLKRLVV